MMTTKRRSDLRNPGQKSEALLPSIGTLTSRNWHGVIRADKLRLLLELEARGIKF